MPLSLAVEQFIQVYIHFCFVVVIMNEFLSVSSILHLLSSKNQ